MYESFPDFSNIQWLKDLLKETGVTTLGIYTPEIQQIDTKHVPGKCIETAE